MLCTAFKNFSEVRAWVNMLNPLSAIWWPLRTCQANPQNHFELTCKIQTKIRKQIQTKSASQILVNR
jgi:hypothetical protein